MSRHKVAVFCLFIGLIGVTCLQATHSLLHTDAARRQPDGRFTAQQLIDRSTPVFRALLPRQNTLCISAEPSTITVEGFKPLCYWNIDGTNEEGKILVRASADAETGDITLVARPVIGMTATQPELSSPLSSHQAGIRALEWLRLLGSTENWRIEAVTKHGAPAWDVRLRSGSRTASLVIETSTGLLYYAYVTPLH